MIIKSFYTKLESKIITHRNEFIEFINSIEQNIDIVMIQDIFSKYIGLKAILPFIHCNNKEIKMFDYDILKYDYDIISQNDNIDIINLVNNNLININKYNFFINMLSKKIINDKKFIL